MLPRCSRLVIPRSLLAGIDADATAMLIAAASDIALIIDAGKARC